MPSDRKPMSNEDWWIDAVEIDTIRSMSLNGAEGLWSSAFVPPPPRPEFLNEDIITDGVTTCDLCTWARYHNVDHELLGDKELGWIMTLFVVSLLSALIGAIVMVIIIKCRKRLKQFGYKHSSCFCIRRDNERETTTISLSNRTANRGISKEIKSTYQMRHERRDVSEKRQRHRSIWSWLSGSSSEVSSQLGSASPTATDNHYTVDEAFPSNGEALYAELNLASSGNPAYQNTAYEESDCLEPDCMLSSAPSSAYYSDFSDRTYEVVGTPDSTAAWATRKFSSPRLSSIHEMISVPSDYV